MHGIEAVVAGYVTTPARSVVKLSLVQQNFHTLAWGWASRVTTPNLCTEGKRTSTICAAFLPAMVARRLSTDYWKDTVFLIVADHDNRVYGNSLVPIHKFHIPGLILGADIQAKKITTIASQIDLGPTLLSLMGVSSTHPVIERDLVRDSTSLGRAMLQFDNYFGWLEGRSATILRPNQAPLLELYDAAKEALTLG